MLLRSRSERTAPLSPNPRLVPLREAYEKHLFCRPRLYEPRGERDREQPGGDLISFRGSVPDEIWEAIWPWAGRPHLRRNRRFYGLFA